MRFGPKKTVVVAIMALVLLSVATTNAGDTITRIEGGNLIYYQKTGTVVRDVPKELTAEQARQLVDGDIPEISFSSERGRSYFGFLITEIKTDTTVSFRKGWITEGKGQESLSVFYLFVDVAILFYGLSTAYMRSTVERILFFVLVSIFVGEVAWLLSDDVGPLQVIGVLSFLFFSGYFFGCYFRRRGEKRKAGQGSISPTIHPHHA